MNAFLAMITGILVAVQPPPSMEPYQPLVNGAQWNYSCSGGIAAKRTISTGSINGFGGYVNMLTLSIPGQATVQFGELQNNDSLGTKIGGFVFAPTIPSVPINPPQLELPINPVIGQMLSFPDGYGGTVTVTYAGLATVNGYLRVFPGAAVFKEVDSGHPPIPYPRNVYMVKGIGEVQTDFSATQNTPAMTCSLANYNIP
jgi:hypothetical protein